MTENKQKKIDLSQLVNLDRAIHAPGRLAIMTYLYAVDNCDYIFLMRITGQTWGNISTHLSKLESVGYVKIKKTFVKKKPKTTIYLTDIGRKAFINYKSAINAVTEGDNKQRIV